MILHKWKLILLLSKSKVYFDIINQLLWRSVCGKSYLPLEKHVNWNQHDHSFWKFLPPKIWANLYKPAQTKVQSGFFEVNLLISFFIQPWPEALKHYCKWSNSCYQKLWSPMGSFYVKVWSPEEIFGAFGLRAPVILQSALKGLG